mmetsp:Transcript_30416/g.61687  ORF Transcript_30416/g.61687 Transcript_30416/m.61687 type:complete len:89 (-) Transcript_30416:59-325(-)
MVLSTETSERGLKTYGKHVFTGSVADSYLKKKGGADLTIFDDPSWVTDSSKADIVAAAVLEWYVCYRLKSSVLHVYKFTAFVSSRIQS